MALNTSMKSVALGTCVLGSLFVGAAASAQCVINPSPDYTQNDGGCPVTGVPDTNGGCNVVPVAFQATGNLSSSSTSFTIGGKIGADAASGSRDIDWYSFTVTDACFVNISVAMTDPAGVASTNIVAFSGNYNTDGTPNCDSVYGYLFSACPAAFPEFFAEPGTYMFIVTTSFATSGGVACESPYTATVSARFTQYAQCGNPASGACGVATPAIGGCQDISCCDKVCTANPLCCDIEWDASCASLAQQPPSAGGCGVFVYNCTPTGPANNCATAAQTIAFNAVTPFDNTAATTDGPNNGQCGAYTRKDVWFAVQANAAGNITCFCNSPTQDVVLSAYDMGTAGPPFDGTQLANNFVGCLDNAGIGGENAVLNGAVAGHWYLWRIGEWDDATNTGTPGAGTVEITLEQVVYDSGVHAAVCNSAGTATNLGLSSGAIGATTPQRWLAAPFTVADPAGTPDAWQTTFFIPEGFQPAGTTNEKMNWILWKRTGSTAPNYNTDQIASGQVAYPTLGANGEAYIPVDMLLEPGDYYMTVFASAVGNPCIANDAQPTLSNYAWFIGAPNGVAFADPANPGGYFQYRATALPGSGPAAEVVVAGTTTPCANAAASPTFPKYTGLNGAYANCTAGGSMMPVYSPALHIYGVPTQSNNCPTDLNGDGTTGSADLAALLSAWGTAGADLNGDGTTGSADLAALLSSWGACP